MRYTLALVALLFCVSGCIPVSSQNGQDLSKLPDFKIEKNVTTEKELVEHFGQPANTTTTGDGNRHLVWTDARGEGHINMAPMLIPFAGKPIEQTITNRSLSATIRDGVVVDYTVSDGSTKM